MCAWATASARGRASHTQAVQLTRITVGVATSPRKQGVSSIGIQPKQLNGDRRAQPVTLRNSARPMTRTLSRGVKRFSVALTTPSVKRVRLE